MGRSYNRCFATLSIFITISTQAGVGTPLIFVVAFTNYNTKRVTATKLSSAGRKNRRAQPFSRRKSIKQFALSLPPTYVFPKNREGIRFLCSRHGLCVPTQKLQAIWEQCGANGIIIVVDIVAVLVDVAVIVHIGGIILIVAGRPQPPPAEEPIQSNPQITSRRTIIVFCRCSSKHRVSFDNRQSALKSVRIAWEEYSLAP